LGRRRDSCSGSQAPAALAFQADWEAALKKAKAENLPILVAFILKGESANEEVVKNHFRDPEIIALSRRFVCLVACLGLHGERQDAPCPAFPGITCADHERVEGRARLELIGSPTVSCPQFIFLKPDGKTVLLRHVWMLSSQELLKKMRLALAFHDPASAPPELRDQRDLVTRLLAEADCNHLERRRSALSSLARIDDPQVVEFLIRQTGAEADGQKRLEAIFFMREHGNAKVLPCLHAILASGDAQTRIYTAVALEGIGMKESTAALTAALKKENKDRVRSHLVRALFACSDDSKLRRGTVLGLIRSTSQLDQVVGLYLAARVERDLELDKALLKALATSNTQVRCAAYFAAGALKVESAREPIQRRVQNERPPALGCALWALEQLGGSRYEGSVDPAAEIHAMLPDNCLYEGTLY
jgi:hypothetical protein